MNKLSVTEPINKAYDLVIKNFLKSAFILYYILLIVASPFIISAIISAFLPDQASFIVLMVGYFVTLVIAFLSRVNLVRYFLDWYDGKNPQLPSVISPLGESFKILLVDLVVSMIIILGFILLVIPGIYFSYRYLFAILIAIDKGYSLEQSLDYSSKITKGNIWRIIGSTILTSLVIYLIIFVGFIALLVGIIPAYGIAMTFSTFALIAMYRELEKNYVANNTKNT